MATWGENSSYQGAASGAATGAVFGGPMGALAGAGVGFVAGGIMGGSQKDAAKRAEEDRQREIQRAIERQNKSEFNAKSQAEQWALADIGVGGQDRALDAQANTKDLTQDVNRAQAELDRPARRLRKPDKYLGAFGKTTSRGYEKKDIAGLTRNVNAATNALNINEGILAGFNDGEPSKY